MRQALGLRTLLKCPAAPRDGSNPDPETGLSYYLKCGRLRRAKSDAYRRSRFPRHAHRAGREWQLPGRRKADTYTFGVAYTDSNGDCDGNNTSSFTDTIGNPTSADAKAAAYAV